MIVGALLTSVGINSGLCVLLFTLYSLLRRQPGNFKIYLPRLLVERGIDSTHYTGLQRLVPSHGWVRRAWKLSEEELLATSGLDAVVFIRIIIFSLRVFSFAGIIGLFVLLPFNCAGTQLASFDITIISAETLELFTISNMNNGSNWLWIHCSAVYLVTAFVCYLLYHEYDYISSKRIAYFYSSRPQPHHFTILVRGIPVPPGCSVSDTVDRFFKEYHPNTYLSHMVIHRTQKIRHLISDTKKLYKSLVPTHPRPGVAKENSTYGSCFGLIPPRVDHEMLRVDGEETQGVKHSDISEVRSAFVSFRSRYATAVASSLQQSEKPTEWVSQQAPEPNDVFWPFFHSSFLQRWISKVVVIVTCVILTVLFIIPVVVAQGLTNLSQLEVWLPFLKGILAKKLFSQIITGYLPNIILQLFLKLVPPVMFFLSSIQGFVSHSEIQKSACYKFLWFLVWNVFFANVLSGSILNQISFLLDVRSIPANLAVGVPAQASFFIAYVVTLGWTSTLSELFCVIQFLRSLLQKCCGCCFRNRSTTDEFEFPEMDYHRELPRILFFGLLGITYFFLAPLILPFLLIYFLLAYIVFKNQFINVYTPKYETAGKFWPIVHNSMIFSLVLMHAIGLGIFTLKKVRWASTIIFPLPVLTLLFNEYCRKRFRPNFVAYSAQNLIKKDREELNDPEMTEFYDRLVTAYKEPALSPVEFSNLDGQEAHDRLYDDPTAPLLSNV